MKGNNIKAILHDDEEVVFDNFTHLIEAMGEGVVKYIQLDTLKDHQIMILRSLKTSSVQERLN